MNIHVMCNNKIAKTILLIFILFIIQIALLYSAECGDVNMDTYIDIADALLIARYFVELPVAVFEPDLADVDGNSVIDIADALLVAQYYVGYITEFPNPCPAAPGPSETLEPTSPDDTPSPLYPDNLDDLTKFIPLDKTSSFISYPNF